MSVVGFDDIDIARQITPPLTTVAVPVGEIAENAFRMLECLIEGRVLENRHIALAAHIVPRGTSAKPAKRDAAA